MTSDILGASKSNISTTIARFAWIITYFFLQRLCFPYIVHYHCQIPTYWIMKLERQWKLEPPLSRIIWDC
jgi:hypothetical protein